MNRGNIPGFYFDEEKKKYFRIQADHAAPTGSKYARSNVKREKQNTKRRKTEQRVKQAVSEQTTKRSAILHRPEIGGIGLGRELGITRPSINHVQADDAFVSQLSPTTHFYSQSGERTVLQTHPIPSTDLTLTAFIEKNHNECTYITTSRNPHIDSCDIARRQTIRTEDESRLVWLSSRVLGLAVWTPPNDSEPSHLIACGAALRNRSNVALARLNTFETRSFPTPVALCIGIGDEETTLWDCRISPDTGSSAVLAATEGLYHLDLNMGRLLSSITQLEESRSLSYLTPTTVAAGSGDKIVLWDTRSIGASVRFHPPKQPGKRQTARVTGARAVPYSNGNQILASTNNTLRLLDVRMPTATHDDKSRSVLSFPLLHETPQFFFDFMPNNSSGIVAGAVQAGVGVWSLRTGRYMRSLTVPNQGPGGRLVVPGLATQITWREDSNSTTPYLQATMGDRLVSWRWMSGQEEDEDSNRSVVQHYRGDAPTMRLADRLRH